MNWGWSHCCRYNGDVLDLMLKLTHKIPDITPKHLAHEVRTNNAPSNWLGLFAMQGFGRLT